MAYHKLYNIIYGILIFQKGQLLHYLQLIVEFVDHADIYVYGKTDLPNKCILKVSGEVLMNETAYRIGHIFNFHIEVFLINRR